MLDTYKKLESLGVIGKMMKVDARGQPVIDPTGEQAGTLVARPFVEFPKWIKRYRADGTSYDVLVQSKQDELRLIAENPDEAMNVPLSPVERDGNELAQQVADRDKALSAMEQRMGEMMAQMAKLSQAIDTRNAESAAIGGGREPLRADESAHRGRGIEALATAAKAE